VVWLAYFNRIIPWFSRFFVHVIRLYRLSAIALVQLPLRTHLVLKLVAALLFCKAQIQIVNTIGIRSMLTWNWTQWLLWWSDWFAFGDGHVRTWLVIVIPPLFPLPVGIRYFCPFFITQNAFKTMLANICINVSSLLGFVVMRL